MSEGAAMERRAWSVPMPKSLGAKLVAILTGVGLAGAIAVAVILALVITPSFNTLENQAVAGHIDRTRAVLQDFATKVESTARDYGDWNASYDYMAKPSTAFEKESFSPLAMVNLDVNGMAYLRPDRSVVIARWLDLSSERELPGMRERFVRAVSGLDFDRMLGGNSSASFYMRIDDTLAAIAVARVRRSDGSGTPRGFVVMARSFSSAQLSELLQLKARIDFANPSAQEAVVARGGRLNIAVPIPGAGGAPVANARFGVPRDLSALGRKMLMLAVLGTVLLFAIVLYVLRRMIARLVLKPLHRVERHMHKVRESGSMGLLTDDDRGDEFGSLVTSFNAMLRQLKDLREQVEVQSFKLGRSESAVAVMHNVRNALNPVSTILSQGLAQPPAADRALLDRAVAELAGEEIPAARRQKLAAFVKAAIDAEANARAERRDQLEAGRSALKHVLEIIGDQQKAAHERPELEPVDVTDIVAQNATIVRYSGERSIAFEFPGAAHWVMANRVILSQVIGNLFANAAESIEARGGEGGSIAVSITEQDGQARISIQDTGEGFDPELGAKLFQRGFSTREHKSGGLGLHWCANSMVAMGGSLKLDSAGRGLGARAVLTLEPVPAERLKEIGLAA